MKFFLSILFTGLFICINSYADHKGWPHGKKWAYNCAKTTDCYIDIENILEQPKFVLSCGGGTPCYYNNMEEINGKTHSFYLQETPKTLADRLQSEKQNRPLVASTEDKDLFEFVAKHLFERRPFYEMANHSVRGEDKIEQIIRRQSYSQCRIDQEYKFF